MKKPLTIPPLISFWVITASTTRPGQEPRKMLNRENTYKDSTEPVPLSTPNKKIATSKFANEATHVRLTTKR